MSELVVETAGKVVTVTINRPPVNALTLAMYGEIADTFDAITHRRTYSVGRTAREAAQAIAEGRGIQFDPDLTDLFLSPPVFDQISRSLGNARKPQVRIEDRRAGKREKEISDITFRWRSGGIGQPAQDLSQQTMR